LNENADFREMRKSGALRVDARREEECYRECAQDHLAIILRLFEWQNAALTRSPLTKSFGHGSVFPLKVPARRLRTIRVFFYPERNDRWNI